MQFVSTRGKAPALPFDEVLLTGLAPDGGLYLPAVWPQVALTAQSAAYTDTAFDIMYPFVDGVISDVDFRHIINDSYDVFDADDVVDMLDMGDNLWLLELFHGPTLAFKDVALQLVGRLFDHVLAAQSRHVTIVGATSGDTGSAAIEACRDRDAIEVFILHPHGRVSDVQRRQMTTVDAGNVHNVAIEGTFDDCQDLVKAMFADQTFRDEVSLGAVNSINWARVMAQIVYYVVASDRVNAALDRPFRSPMSFTVPTGNFGNVFAGWGARQMGLPIDRFCVASNSNDILTRFFNTGTMTIEGVEPTLSPSMDIQISSNLERLLFELFGRDGQRVADLMAIFRETGTVSIDPTHLSALSETWAGRRVDDQGDHGVIDTIRQVHDELEYVLDPHSAVGVAAARQLPPSETPMVCLGTAHPAKFPDAVEQATGSRPGLPDRLGDLFEREEKFDVLPNDLATVQAHVRSRRSS